MKGIFFLVGFLAILTVLFVVINKDFIKVNNQPNSQEPEVPTFNKCPQVDTCDWMPQVPSDKYGSIYLGACDTYYSDFKPRHCSGVKKCIFSYGSDDGGNCNISYSPYYPTAVSLENKCIEKCYTPFKEKNDACNANSNGSLSCNEPEKGGMCSCVHKCLSDFSSDSTCITGF